MSRICFGHISGRLRLWDSFSTWPWSLHLMYQMARWIVDIIWYYLWFIYHISIMTLNISRCKSVMSCHVRPSIAHPIASWSLPDTKCPVISDCDKLKELLYLASFLHFWCFCLVPFFSFRPWAIPFSISRCPPGRAVQHGDPPAKTRCRARVAHVSFGAPQHYTMDWCNGKGSG